MLFSILALMAVEATAATITGVNLGGWLLIEEWMFSNGQFDRVAEEDDSPQGVIMPPLLPDGPGFNWYSEGDLISKLADAFSPEFAVEVIEAHRSSYITDEDVQKMKEAGISAVRMPLGYWAFLGGSYNDEAMLYTDPAHEDKKFVTISTDFLTSQVRVARRGCVVLLVVVARSRRLGRRIAYSFGRRIALPVANTLCRRIAPPWCIGKALRERGDRRSARHSCDAWRKQSGQL